jgi:cation:H+ antiporter
MSVLIDLISLVGGGVVLYFGAEWLVQGAAGLARAFGVKPLVIGLTVIAYGTSAPELAVSASAILEQKDGLVLGNVIGSCIANVGLILGITALLSPPVVDGTLIKREVPILLLSVFALPLVLWNGSIGWLEGSAFFAASVLFTVLTLWAAKQSPSPLAEMATADAEESASGGRGKMTAIAVVGLVALWGGGNLFVFGAEGIARAIGVSDRVIGLTVVAIGTSLPELAASVVAALRGHSSLAVGNVIGSNIFNIFLILGVVPMLRPVSGPLAELHVDLYFLIGLTLLGAVLMRGDRRITRAEGVILLTVYLGFLLVAFFLK